MMFWTSAKQLLYVRLSSYLNWVNLYYYGVEADEGQKKKSLFSMLVYFRQILNGTLKNETRIKVVKYTQSVMKKNILALKIIYYVWSIKNDSPSWKIFKIFSYLAH